MRALCFILTLICTLLASTTLKQPAQAPSNVDRVEDLKLDFGHVIWRDGKGLIPDATAANQALLDIQLGNPKYQSLKNTSIHGTSLAVKGKEIENALAKLPLQLEELHYRLDEPISKSTLRFLEKSHPDCRLYYEISFGSWGKSLLTHRHDEEGDSDWRWISCEIVICQALFKVVFGFDHCSKYRAFEAR